VPPTTTTFPAAIRLLLSRVAVGKARTARGVRRPKKT
jgi:hypothetical protein